MPSYSRHLPDLFSFAISLIALMFLARLALGSTRLGDTSARRRQLRFGAWFLALWICVSALLSFYSVALHIPQWWVNWIRGTGFVVAMSICAAVPVALFWRALPQQFDPGRRRVLSMARTATFAAPVVLSGFAVVRRNDLRLQEVEIAVAGLPADLDGLRLVQLSDIHMSPFLSAADLDRAVDMANETRAHVALVTGDLTTSPRDPLERCIDGLARLRADAGVFGCMGNHEIYTKSEKFVTAHGARRGLEFLRGGAKLLRFGNAGINIAGVDYQRFGHPYLKGADRLLAPSVPNILLSHNPDVFATAAQQGWDLTLAGHTHGGQVNFEILSANLNIMRMYTPFTYGRYEDGKSSIYVTRGIGTVGVPARIGAPPEVALIRLRRA
jgi:predicted MPP superfamily phosphohydrolase